MLLTSFVALAAASLPCSFPQAEGSHGAELPPAVTPGQLAKLANALLIDEPGDGTTWARAATWKASFGADGFSFLPFLGSDAPQNFPLTLDVAGVWVGGEPLPLAQPARRRSNREVTLDRGAMRDVYHLRDGSVEQTFVFDALPNLGEVVIDLGVQTELVGRADGAGFLFSCELGSVAYGAATAVDASGHRLGLTQRLTKGGIQIVVPAEYVRSAQFPIVVDPILSTLAVTSDTRRQHDLDVAYEHQNSTYQIVFSEIQSGIDEDVIAVHYSTALDLLLPAESIDITSANWRQPRNAAAYEQQQFLCVAVVGSIGSRRVWGRTREATTGVRGSQFLVSGFGAETVDIGGKGNDIQSIYDYMVVWQEVDSVNQDFDIVAQAVNGDGTLTGGRIVIDGDPANLDRYPSISKTSGFPSTSNPDQEYMLAWERELAPDNADIHCQVIEYTGSVNGHAPFRAYSFSEARRPDVSSWKTFHSYNFEPYWTIAFERRTGANFDIFALIARDGNPDNARSIPVMQDYDSGLNHRRPQIVHEAFFAHIAYAVEEANGDHSVYYTTVNTVHDDGELRLGTNIRRRLVGTSAEMPEVRITSLMMGGANSAAGQPGGAMIGWLERPTATRSDVNASLMFEAGLTVAGSQYCDANPNSTGDSAWIRASRSTPAFPGATLRLTCIQLPTNSFGHFLCSLQQGFVPNPAGSAGNLCLQGSVGRFNRPGEILNSGADGEFFLQFQSSNLPSPTGTVGALSGESWYFQTWFRDLGPTSNFSNGVEVTFD